MPLADLLAGRESFDDIRRMGPQRSWAESQAELAQQERLRQALGLNQERQPMPIAQGLSPVGPFATMQRDIGGSLADLLKRFTPQAQAAPR